MTVSLTGCNDQPAAPAQEVDLAAPSPAVAAAAPIEGFKFLRLSMTLEEVARLQVAEFDYDRDMKCIAEGQAQQCLVADQTIAGTPAEVQAWFFAIEPIVSASMVPVPPLHEITQQEIRMGNAAGENSKRAASVRARAAAIAENRERHLKSLAPFTLAAVVVAVDRQHTDHVRQALEDRYGAPMLDGAPPLPIWSNDPAQIVMFPKGGETLVAFRYLPLHGALEAHQESLRRKRAGDL